MHTTLPDELKAPERPARKAIPLGVKVHACLLLLGFTEEEIQAGIDWDHYPAISHRPVNDDGTDYSPAQLDPRYIRPMRRGVEEEHGRKTHGRKGESKFSSNGGGDTTVAARLKRLEDKRYEEARTKLLAPAEREEVERKKKPRSQWPQGRKLQSRNSFKRQGR